MLLAHSGIFFLKFQSNLSKRHYFSMLAIVALSTVFAQIGLWGFSTITQVFYATLKATSGIITGCLLLERH